MIRKAMLLAGALGMVALAAGSVRAQTYSTPAKGGPIVKTSFVRAADSCTGSAVTVHIDESGLPGAGCIANSTDDLAFGKATLVLHKAHGKFVLNGNGFTAGDSVHMVLNLQVTRKNTTTSAGTKDVTFPPSTAACASVVANSKGVILQKTTLDTCTGVTQKLVDPTPGLEGGTDSKNNAINIEVLGVSLVNDTSGKAFASAGIIR